MPRTPTSERLVGRLEALGADFSRWPPEDAARAREALAADPAFRRAFERERAVDRAVADCRDLLDAAIRRSGAVARVRNAAMQAPANPLAGLKWRRVAAAVLVAGMAGGAVGMALPQRSADAADMALVVPYSVIDDIDGADLR